MSIETMRRALERIAYEPQGEAVASHAEVLRAVELIARDALIEDAGSPVASGARLPTEPSEEAMAAYHSVMLYQAKAEVCT